MRAAIYARKSNDEGERAEQEKSVTQQTEAARRFIESRGWTLVRDAVYKDDAVSGARTTRPGFDALCRDAKAKLFDVVVVDSQDRIARASIGATERMLERLALPVYDTRGALISFDDDEAELPTTMTAMFAAWERKQARKRTLRALREKARAGYATGGDVFGYRRERLSGFVEYRINDAQAEVVRQIFRMYLAGFGPRAIAKAMNGDPDYREQLKRFFGGDRPEKPVVGKRGCGSWAPTSIHCMLRNARYIGQLTYGRVKRGKYRDDGIQDRKAQRDASAILRAERPDLRIVPKELWDAVQKRIAAEHKAYLALAANGQHSFGRPDVARAGRYLLSGLLRCGVCGGNLTANVQHSGTRARKRLVVYLCARRNNRGKTACSNTLRIREEVLNRHIVDALRIPRDIILAAARKALAKPKPVAEPNRPIAKLEREKERLVAAIRLGGQLESLVEALRACEKALESVRSEPKAVALSEVRLARDLAAVEAGLDRLLSLGVAEARELLRTVLPGPVTVSPEAVGKWLLKGERLVNPVGLCRGMFATPTHRV